MAHTSTKYELTGIYSVDMVAAAVEWHAENLKPLKTIFLKTRFFHEFKNWAQRKHGAEIEALTFEHIEIKEGSALMIVNNDIYFEFYKQPAPVLN